METPQGVERMRIVGGNLALDFVNSRTGPPSAPPDDDVLHGYTDLVDWAEYAGGSSRRHANALRRAAMDRPREASRRFREALEVRDLLDRVVRALSEGRQPGTDDLAALRMAQAEAIRHAELVARNGGYTWTWANDPDLGQPIRPVVHAAVQLLTGGQLGRLKACAGCQFVFLDETKNRSRRWCSMLDCGSAEKIRNYVRRRAERRTSGTSGTSGT